MDAELEGFHKAQALAYECVLKSKTRIHPEMTEIQAAEILKETLFEAGIKDWFHTPLAWFGERTRFQDMRGYRDFLPSERTLSENDVVILDVAPLVEGYLADVGYTYSLGPSPELDLAKETLLELRSKIPVWFNELSSLGEIWKTVESHLQKKGFDNCYRLYPFSVLGHRVGRLNEHQNYGRSRLSVPVGFLSWFGLSAYRFFIKTGVFPALLRRRSNQTKMGLWAIEPHLGGAGFGAKFEEILVVDENGARWMSEDVPHVKEA